MITARSWKAEGCGAVEIFIGKHFFISARLICVLGIKSNRRDNVLEHAMSAGNLQTIFLPDECLRDVCLPT